MSEQESSAAQTEQTEAETPAPEKLSPGECLKQAREQAGLSPEQVAKDLYLDTRVIRAIEVDHFKEVGAPVYVKGYLRRYAKLVGLAEEGVLASYATLSDAPLTIDPIPATHGSIPEPRRTLPGWVWWAVVLLLVIVAAVKLLPDIWQETSAAVSTVVPTTTTTDANTDSPLNSSEARETPLAVTNGVVPAVTTDVVAPATVANAMAAATVTKNIAPATPGSGNVTMQLQFTDASWVEVYDANNQTLLYDMGSPTAPRVVNGAPPWRVTLGSASVVQVTINGRVRSVPANRLQANVAHFVVNAAGDIE